MTHGVYNSSVGIANLVNHIHLLSGIQVTEDCDLTEALRLLVRERGAQMLLVTDDTSALQGIVTKTDILRAVKKASEAPQDH